jgi:hypothetical protein
LNPHQSGYVTRNSNNWNREKIDYDLRYFFFRNNKTANTAITAATKPTMANTYSTGNPVLAGSGDGVAEAVGEGDGLGEAVDTGEGVGEANGFGVGVGVAAGGFVGVGVAVGVEVGDGVGVGVGVGD